MPTDRHPDCRAADEALGMNRPITRRDFVQGVAVGGIGLLAAPLLAQGAAQNPASPIAAQDMPGYYPPSLVGLRGSHPGSFEAAHGLRQGPSRLPASPVDEPYDLVVVGAGISGLAAAHFYRARVPNARILLLDNHDDFGGHAKRNEFMVDGQMRLMNGGTLGIDSPRPYSAVSHRVLHDIGIDAEALAKSAQHPEYYQGLGLGYAAFFDRETYGRDHLAVGYRTKPWAEFLAGAPLSDRAKADVERIETGTIDYMPGLTSMQKKRRLMKISYRDYLLTVAQVDPQAAEFYQSRTKGEWGVGADAVSALDAWGIDLPGFEGLKLAPGSIPGMGFTPAGYVDTGGSTKLHFPDGNATVARALVRHLIPGVMSARGIEELVTARLDYAELDRPTAPVRLRLSSIVTRVRNAATAGVEDKTEITYVRDGRAYSVRATNCVLACYNMIIPYLMPELPEAQKQALHELVKTPLVYTSVAIRNWRAFAKLGVQMIYAPGSYHTTVRLDPTVDIGSYKGSRNPDEPSTIWMDRTPCKFGLSEHDQNRAGRAELLATPFEDIERSIREQLARTLGPGGFDPATDITAITVNRWPHGYAPEHNSLWQPEMPESHQPHVVGRKRFGSVAIANSDAGGGAYTDIAIDQAHRAVHELLGA